ncbi:MAG: Hsp70 family protein, partial [Clostridiaceae bacterium]|nr:Hsp70 family protein [Clostridiaceae bacterium]
TLKDLGDKLSPEDKSKVEAEVNKVKEVLKGTDNQAIKEATESLTQAFYAISQKMYQQAGPQGQNPNDASGFNANAGNSGDQDNVYNADYKVVDEDDKE